MMTYPWLRLVLYSLHQKYKKKGHFWVRPTLSKRKIWTYRSLPYSTFESLNPSPQHTAKGPQCAETSLQVVKLATKQKPSDIYRPVTWLGVELRKAQTSCRNVWQTMQNCCRCVAKKMSFCFVSLVWTRPRTILHKKKIMSIHHKIIHIVLW